MAHWIVRFVLHVRDSIKRKDPTVRTCVTFGACFSLAFGVVCSLFIAFVALIVWAITRKLDWSGLLTMYAALFVVMLVVAVVFLCICIWDLIKTTPKNADAYATVSA
jgi:predicted PurR-regulated permease PerM